MNGKKCNFSPSFLQSALEERSERPQEKIKSRAWREAVYSHFLNDPEALEQFAKQAMKKFGVEDLSRMVVPELRKEL